MTPSNIKPMTAETLRDLSLPIREAWRTDNMKVFLALCIKEYIRQGGRPDITVASTCIIIREWLDNYLEKNHAATVTTADSLELVLSLLRESVNLVEVLS